MAWVIRDLVNGNGADGRPIPTYVWASATREPARVRKREHMGNPEYAKLGPVERWPSTLFHFKYEKVGGISANWPCAYYRRKD